MSPVVVDASVAVKYVLEEEHTATALRILSTRELLAPDLLWAEIGNTLWKRHHRQEATLDVTRRQLADVRRLPVRACAHWPLMPVALDLAVSLGQTVYDCLYLALAEERGSVVITADRRFHRAVAASAWADRIVWIEDVP